jgi:hypothetical protein
VKRCLEFPIERLAYSELERWQAAIELADVGGMRRRQLNGGRIVR